MLDKSGDTELPDHGLSERLRLFFSVFSPCFYLCALRVTFFQVSAQERIVEASQVIFLCVFLRVFTSVPSVSLFSRCQRRNRGFSKSNLLEAVLCWNPKWSVETQTMGHTQKGSPLAGKPF